MANSVLAKMAVQISANTADFNRALNQTNKTLSGFQNGIKNMAGALGVAFTAQKFIQGAQYAIRTLRDFEYQMDTVRAITGATDNQFERLKKNAIDLGSSTEYTATQVGKLQTEFGRLGFSADEIINATEATLNLATATGEDLAKSADVAGSTLRGFRLDSLEMNRVVDVMASSFNKSALSLENFRESMKYVAPIAKTTGASIEETTALLSVLADAGIRGSQAGTGLRRIFSELSNDGRPLIDRLKELSEKGLTLAGAQDEVGAYAKTALLVLTAQTDQVEKLTTAYDNAAGEGKRVAAIMRDNLTGDIKILESAIDGAILKGEGWVSVMRKMTQGFTFLVSALSGSSLTKTAEDFDRATKAIEGYKKLYDEALAAGQRDKALQYAKVIADLTAGFGLLRDKAVEAKDDVAGSGLVPELSLIEKIREKIKQQEDFLNSAKTVTEVQTALRALEQYKAELASLTTINTPSRGAAKPLRTDLTPSAQSSASIFGLGNISVPGIEEITKSIDTVNKKFREGQVSVETWGAQMKVIMEETAKNTIDVSGLIVGGIVDIASAFGEAAVTGAQDFGRAFLRSLGRFAQQFGALLIATGIGEKFLEKGTPGQKIAAGIALVAIGGAISALMANKPSLSGGGEGGSAFNRVSVAGQSFSDINITGRLYGEGSQLIAVLENAKSSNGRRRA